MARVQFLERQRPAGLLQHGHDHVLQTHASAGAAARDLLRPDLPADRLLRRSSLRSSSPSSSRSSRRPSSPPSWLSSWRSSWLSSSPSCAWSSGRPSWPSSSPSSSAAFFAVFRPPPRPPAVGAAPASSFSSSRSTPPRSLSSRPSRPRGRRCARAPPGDSSVRRWIAGSGSGSSSPWVPPEVAMRRSPRDLRAGTVLVRDDDLTVTGARMLSIWKYAGYYRDRAPALRASVGDHVHALRQVAHGADGSRSSSGLMAFSGPSASEPMAPPPSMRLPAAVLTDVAVVARGRGPARAAPPRLPDRQRHRSSCPDPARSSMRMRWGTAAPMAPAGLDDRGEAVVADRRRERRRRCPPTVESAAATRYSRPGRRSRWAAPPRRVPAGPSPRWATAVCGIQTDSGIMIPAVQDGAVLRLVRLGGRAEVGQEIRVVGRQAGDVPHGRPSAARSPGVRGHRQGRRW